MNRRSLLVAVVLVMSLSVSTAFAQHTHSGSSAQASTPEIKDDPMQECQRHHAEGAAALDQAGATLARARQLTDADQMQAAIELSQKQIAEAKHHLSMCPMAQAGSMDHSAMDDSQHQQHKMKCMSKDSQSR